MQKVWLNYGPHIFYCHPTCVGEGRGYRLTESDIEKLLENNDI